VPLWKTLLLVTAGCAVGIGAGICCARQDEGATDADTVESRRDDSASGKHTSEEPPDAAPWLRINGAPPTRVHYCLFFGAWGALIGALLAAGGNPAVALPAGVVGGLLWLFVERASVGLMVERGFVQAHEPNLAVLLIVAFLAATAAAHYSSFKEKKKPKRRLPDPV
jgi:hypothetical protein